MTNCLYLRWGKSLHIAYLSNSRCGHDEGLLLEWFSWVNIVYVVSFGYNGSWCRLLLDDVSTWVNSVWHVLTGLLLDLRYNFFSLLVVLCIWPVFLIQNMIKSGDRHLKWYIGNENVNFEIYLFKNILFLFHG